MKVKDEFWKKTSDPLYFSPSRGRIKSMGLSPPERETRREFIRIPAREIKWRIREVIERAKNIVKHVANSNV